MRLKGSLALEGITLQGGAFPNGRILPGIVQNISVNGTARVDVLSSGKSAAKAARGMDNKTVGITLLLVGDIKGGIYEQLEELEKIFQDANGGIPNVFTITNKHLQGRQVNNMLFQSFSSSEGGSGEELTVHLNFEEFAAAENSSGGGE